MAGRPAEEGEGERFDEVMLKNMGSAILSEIFGAAKIMIEALQLVEMPDWTPSTDTPATTSKWA